MKPNSPTPLWSQIIASQTHAVVEASAGTGKTYTIEHYILELLSQKWVHLENILLVTFTDKATGELKDRIRGGIAQLIQDLQRSGSAPTEQLAHLEYNLAMVDSAPISTIHGFCLRTLQSMSYDAGLPIQTQLVDDQEGLLKSWRTLLRTHWVQDYLQKTLEQEHPTPGTDLSLQAQEFAELIFEECGDLSKEVLQFAHLWNQTNLSQHESLWEIYRNYVQDRQTLADFADLEKSHLPDYKVHAQALLQELGKLDKLTGDLQSLQNFCAQIINASSALAPIGRIRNPNKIHDLLNKPSSKKQGFHERYAALGDLWALFMNANPKGISPKIPKAPIAGYFSRIVQSLWQAQKQQRGLLSFDDMIRLLAAQLQSGNQALLNSLRQKFHYGIVDEFQDTDDAQWGIFKQIFLESPLDEHGYPCNKLLVVGDPKQAIYGFRGADLDTYFSAKNAIVARSAQAPYVLQHNFRSTPAMIQAYNYLFHLGKSTAELMDENEPKWFCNPQIQYSLEGQVQPGKEDFSAEIALSPDFLQKPLKILDLQEFPNAPSKYQNYAQWAADQIVLLMQDSQNCIAQGMPGRALSLNDIAVLCRSKPTMEYFKEALNQAHIPWDIYKESGVFQSDECYHWLVLLRALRQSAGDLAALRSVALSPFGNIALDVLESGGSELSEILSQLRSQIAQWSSYANAQKWSKMVRHINQESPYFAISLQDETHGDRRLSNLSQIQNQCLKWWIEENLSLEDVILRLSSYHEDPKLSAENESLYQIAHEKPKVRFLTMHTSKGLEFPVVFNMMGTTLTDLSKYYLDREQAKVYFDKSADQCKEKTAQKNTEEYSRLLYVSLTRASLVQYAPLYGTGKSGLNHFLSQFSQNPQCCDLIQAKPLHLQLPQGEPSPAVQKQDLQLLDQRLQHISASAKPMDQYSFTKISPQSTEQIVHENYDETELPVDEEESPSLPSVLPPGKNTGLFWHALFEKIDWQYLLSFDSLETLAELPCESDSPETAKLKSLLLHEQYKYGLGANSKISADLAYERRLETLQMMHRVLSTPIPDPFEIQQRGLNEIPALPSQTFRLGDLEPKDRKAELDFLCPVQADGQAFALEPQESAGFLTGSLDLVFRYQGRYYILDWKSNFLKKGYKAAELHAAVLHSHYHLQAAIYAMALNHWLKGIDPNYHAEQHFGGVIYAFVRGMGHESQGLWLRRPSEQDWQSGFASSMPGQDLQTLLCESLEC